MNPNGCITRTLDKAVQAIFHTAVMLTVIIVLLVCMGIFSRYLFRYPLNWVPGVVTLLTDWAVFLMVGVYIYRNQGVIITYFYERVFPPKVQRIVLFVVDLIIFAFTTIAGWHIWMAMGMGNYLSSISTLPISYNWYTAPFFAAMLLGAIGTVKRLVWRKGT